jgi:hypothetical protein
VDRHRFIIREGRRILRVDYTGLSPDEHVAALEPVAELICRQRSRRLLLMTLANDRFTAESTAAIKRYARTIAPFVLANAIVGRRGFRSALLMAVWGRTGRELAAFEDEASALSWLVSLSSRLGGR